MLLDVLSEQNPQWQNDGRGQGPGFERDIVARLEPILSGPLPGGVRRAVVLSGLRRSGKSTVLRQLASRLARQAESPTDVVYLDLGDPRILGISVEGLLEATGLLRTRPATRTLLLDEVGHDRVWPDSIKRLVDLGPDAPGIIVADSAAARLRASPGGETAVGRRIDLELTPMTLGEIARASGLSTGDPRDADPQRLGMLADEYLVRGGLPEVALPGSPSFTSGDAYRILREDAANILALDAPRIREVRDVHALRRLWAMLARGASLSLNVGKIASALEISRQTVEQLLSVLSELFLVREVPCRGDGPAAPIRNPPKWLVADPGIAAAHLTENERGDPVHRGYLVESAAALHLAAARQELPGLEITYARAAKEIDFVVRHPDIETVGIEMKHFDRPAEAVDDERAARVAAEFGVRTLIRVTRQPVPRLAVVAGCTIRTEPLWRFLNWPVPLLKGGIEP
jgi:predicted AAA+ superfamily ATPase